jgi:hypothetical protein
MFYLQEALANLSPLKFYELSLTDKHRTLDAFDRTITQFPYLIKLPELHARLARLWQAEVTTSSLDRSLRTKVEYLLVDTQALMASAGLNPLVVLVSLSEQELICLSSGVPASL